MNWDNLLLRVQSVGAAYLLGGPQAAGWALVFWTAVGLFGAWK